MHCSLVDKPEIGETVVVLVMDQEGTMRGEVSIQPSVQAAEQHLTELLSKGTPRERLRVFRGRHITLAVAPAERRRPLISAMVIAEARTDSDP